MIPLIRPRGKQPLLKPFLLAAAFLAAFLMAAGSPGLHAQNAHQYSFPDASGTSGRPNWTGERAVVPTGRGPLAQPVPPAASVYMSRRLGRVATPTDPSPYPFGTQ
jgi:hypothetical protein